MPGNLLRDAVVDPCSTTLRVIFALAVLAPVAAAQAKDATAVERRARSLVNQVELPERRVAAIDELLSLGADAVPALAARLSDPRPEVVQVVCAVLCKLGPLAEAALPQLVIAQGSPDAAVAHMARLTEMNIRPSGKTLVAEFERGKVVEIAADGTQREVLGTAMPWDVDPLPGGHLLVTLYIANRVVEYDEKGNEVWSFADLKMPLEADRLLDGRTLIADTYGQRVIEVGARGDVVWEWKAEQQQGQPYDVERLANGRTLVALFPSLVLEVDRAGEVVWQLDSPGGVFDADRLPNGNTLLTLFNAGSVREVDSKGTVVWEAKGLAGPNDADRLPSGNTLVTTSDGFVELAPDGSIVAQSKGRKRVSKIVRR
ncbi:MAG TPA: PQQ-binding-like beta-propeller repeat protein [Planctomycetota bacterium]